MAYTSDTYRHDIAIEQQLRRLREEELSILGDRVLTGSFVL